MTEISKLYKVGEEIVFYKVGNNDRRNEIHKKILNEEVVCIDTSGNVLGVEEAARFWLAMCNYNHRPTTTEEGVFRNISLYPIITSIVRAELYNEENGLQNMITLKDVITTIQIGLFSEGADLLESMPRDSVFTEQRLRTWEYMLRASNAV